MNKQESDDLKVLQEMHNNMSITHWVINLGVKNLGFKCHIFTIKIDTINQLKDIWNKFTENIAFFFQDGFENKYESWNVYVVFFTGEKIPRPLKYEIENNRYSSRKIVMDEISPPIDENKIKEKISKRIFQLNIGVEKITEKPQKDLSKILDQKLIKRISGIEIEARTKAGREQREKIHLELLEEYSHEIKKD